MTNAASPEGPPTPPDAQPPAVTEDSGAAPRSSILERLLSPRIGYGLVLVVYLFAFPYHPLLRSPNELCRLWQTRALVEYGTLEVNQALADYGRVGDLSVKDGKYYPSKAPLLSFAAVPIYATLRAWYGNFRYAVPELALIYWSRFFLTVLPTLGMLVLLRRFLRAHVDQGLADALTVAYALGTLALSYSLLFMSHQATAVLLFASFFALWRCARGEWKPKGYLVAGAAAGASVAAEYTSALGVGALLVYGVLSVWWAGGDRVKRLFTGIALTTLGALPFVIALGAYHQAVFDHPLASGYKYLADAGYQPWHLGGFLGIRTPDPRAFALSFFSPLRGLFMLSPMLLAGIAGVALVFRQAREDRDARALAWFTLVLLLGYTYFTSSFSYRSWGWTTGPRHLTGLVPFLLLPVGLSIRRLRESGRTAGIGVVAGLSAAAVLVTGWLSLLNYIPDDVSSPFFALSIPLLTDGYLPPTALTATRSEAPGVLAYVLLAAIVAAAIWVAARMLAGSRGRGLLVGGTLAVLAVGLHLGTLRGFTEYHSGDVGALRFLEQVWLTPPEGTLRVWPARR